MKAIFCSIALFLLVASCQRNKPSVTKNDTKVSQGMDSLYSKVQSEPEPPVAADGLFDDFVYSFMRNHRFQLERIDFPLPNFVDGKNHPISKHDWKYDCMYMHQDVYTIIFDSEKSVSAEKDTTIRQVVVEWAYLHQQRVKQYHFAKDNGVWRLKKLDTHAMANNPNHDFYVFYNRFSSDKTYQNSHILNPFHFKTYDYDNFQTVEGLLDVTQWPDYRPTLPKGTITNINYGQHYRNSHKRVLFLCSPSGGMGCSMTFVRQGKDWMLARLDN